MPKRKKKDTIERTDVLITDKVHQRFIKAREQRVTWEQKYDPAKAKLRWPGSGPR